MSLYWQYLIWGINAHLLDTIFEVEIWHFLLMSELKILYATWHQHLNFGHIRFENNSVLWHWTIKQCYNGICVAPPVSMHLFILQSGWQASYLNKMTRDRSSGGCHERDMLFAGSKLCKYVFQLSFSFLFFPAPTQTIKFLLIYACVPYIIAHPIWGILSHITLVSKRPTIEHLLVNCLRKPSLV